jgi:microcompartment protein CcmL/EutN
MCGVAAAIADGATIANMLEWQDLEDSRKEIDRENEQIIKALSTKAVLSSERQETVNAHSNHPSSLSLGRFIGRWLATTLGYRTSS